MFSPDFSSILSDTTRSIPMLGAGLLTVIAVFIVVSLILERALTVIYTCSVWEKFIGAPLRAKGIGDTKLYLAIIVNIVFMFATKLDAFALLLGADSSFVGTLITGLFSSGGAKVWADLFSHIQKVRDGKIEDIAVDLETKRSQLANPSSGVTQTVNVG